MIKTVTGKPRTSVTGNPKIAEGTVIMSWVSMNPPTKNHEKLISEMAGYAGDQIIFLEPGDSFPLSYANRFEAAKEAFPEVIEDHDFSNIMEAMVALSKIYADIVIVMDETKIENIENAMVLGETEEIFNFTNWSVVSNKMLDVDHGSVSGYRLTDIREAFLSGDTALLEEILPISLSYIPEGLTVSQRIKRGNNTKRREAVLQSARKRVLARHAEKGRLQKRSRTSAIDTIKQKLAGGQKTADLSYGDKARIEDILKTKKGAVNNLSRKLLNKVRDRENKRHADKNTNKGA